VQDNNQATHQQGSPNTLQALKGLAAPERHALPVHGGQHAAAGGPLHKRLCGQLQQVGQAGVLEGARVHALLLPWHRG